MPKKPKTQAQTIVPPPDVQGLRGELQDALLRVHRAAKRRKKASEAVDGAETDLRNAARHVPFSKDAKDKAAQALVLCLEELLDRDAELKDARTELKAIEKRYDGAVAQS